VNPKPVREGGREALKVARASTPTHRHLRSRLIFLFIATVIFDAVASVLIFAFERHAPGDREPNLGDSVFWTSTQTSHRLLPASESDLDAGVGPRRLTGMYITARYLGSPPGFRNLLCDGEHGRSCDERCSMLSDFASS
jgi:hypothetical protein